MFKRIPHKPEFTLYQLSYELDVEKITSQCDPNHRDVGTLSITDFIPNFLSSFGNRRLDNGLVRHSLVGPGRKLNPYIGHRLPQDC